MAPGHRRSLIELAAAIPAVIAYGSTLVSQMDKLVLSIRRLRHDLKDRRAR